MKTYIEDVHSSDYTNSASSDTSHSRATKLPSTSNIQLSSTATSTCVPQFTKELKPEIDSFISFFDFLDFPMPAKHPSSYDSEISNLQVDLFIHKFSECLNLDISANNKFLFTIGSPSSQVLEWQEVFNKDQTNKIYSDNQTTPSQGTQFFLAISLLFLYSTNLLFI